MPKRFEEREFGYFRFNSQMIRHLSFNSLGDLRALIIKHVPKSVYYSVSFYQDPEAEMNVKGWKGGEIAFDIDCDDLVSKCKYKHDYWFCKSCGLSRYGKRPKTCKKCLSDKLGELNWVCQICLDGAKNEVFKLLEILDELGMSLKKSEIFFSGHMGYHLTIESEEFLDLDQPARSELADYISGLHVNSETLGISKSSIYEDLVKTLPEVSESGWRGRIARGFHENFDDIDGSKVSLAQKITQKNYRWLNKQVSNMSKIKGVSIDSAVTTDIHRIFRLPNTLHGETGFVKCQCDLDNFNPFVDPIVFSDELCKVKTRKIPVITLMDQKFGPYNSGEIVNLPFYMSVYLMGQGLAEVV
tara:strand:+ start:507 stop:1577 length:1071 start_codon:yes stop_codon:yes gene_type:complete